MKNEIFFKTMVSQIGLTVQNQFAVELKKDLNSFWEINKDLSEDEFCKLFNDKFLYIITISNNNKKLSKLKSINAILIFFLVLSIISAFISLLIFVK